MKLHIVKCPGTWILVKLAERMYKAGQEIGLEMSMSHEASPNADVNFYVDLQNTYFNQKTNKDVALFTHADKNSSD